MEILRLNKHEDDQDGRDPDFDVDEVFTAYNGLCMGVRVAGRHEAKVTARFSLPPGEGGESLFFLRTPEERVTLAFQELIP